MNIKYAERVLGDLQRQISIRSFRQIGMSQRNLETLNTIVKKIIFSYEKIKANKEQFALHGSLVIDLAYVVGFFQSTNTHEYIKPPEYIEQILSISKDLEAVASYFDEKE